MAKHLDYDTGYKKPPKANQFKKGTSGNPQGRGRKKPRRGALALLEDAMHEKITVNVNGKRTRITKVEALILQLMNGALSGQTKELNALLKYLPLLEKYAEKNNDPAHLPVQLVIIDDISNIEGMEMEELKELDEKIAKRKAEIREEKRGFNGSIGHAVSGAPKKAL